jgi:hypothetical protein
MSVHQRLRRVSLELPQKFAADQEERVMQRNDEQRDNELIDLGSVSEETRGASFISQDTEGQRLPLGGISDD